MDRSLHKNITSVINLQCVEQLFVTFQVSFYIFLINNTDIRYTLKIF